MGTLTIPTQGDLEAVTLNTVGDTVVVTPAPRARLRVYWVGMSTSQDNVGENIVTVSIGTRVKYKWAMGNPGAFSHRDIINGEIGEALIVNLTQIYPVFFNYSFEEVY